MNNMCFILLNPVDNLLSGEKVWCKNAVNLHNHSANAGNKGFGGGANQQAKRKEFTFALLATIIQN